MGTTLKRRTFLVASSLLPIVACHGAALARVEELNVTSLKPGSYLWKPELSPSGPVAVIVSLGDQACYVYRNGIRIGVSTISSGREGFDTPTGVFNIYLKQTMHHSTKYENAPMPDSEFFSGGAALHAGGLPGYPSSHGCVHLPRGFAKLLFGVTHNGTPVIITNQKFGVGSLEHAGFLMTDNDLEKIAAATGQQGKAAPLDQRGYSDTAYSVVISGADRKVLVFKNGQLFYEAPVEFKGFGKLGEHVYELVGNGATNSLKFIAIDTSGEPEKTGLFPNAAQLALSRVVISDQAKQYISSLLHAGSTVVLTDFSAGNETRTGNDFVVMNVKN